MNPIAVFWSGQSKVEVAREVEEEMAFHLEQLVQTFIRAGHSQEQAERMALMRFGDRERLSRECVQTKIGDQIMWQKIHLAFTLLLLVAVAVMAQRSLHARAVAADQAQNARAVTAQLMERFSEQRPYAVGDEILMLLEGGPDQWRHNRVVQSDGMVLLPDYGWLPVAGMNEAQAESAVANARQPLYLGNVRAHLSLQKAIPGEAPSVEELVLRTGDRLSLIDLHGVVEPWDIGITVSTEGRAQFPELGALEVAGMTRAQLEKRLNELLDPFYADKVNLVVRVAR